MAGNPRDIYTGNDARTRLLQGADKMARAVAVTYGPGGRTCIMERMAGMLTTKDGVTVAREVFLADHLENQGCQILKEACINVNNEVGDGTTTVAVLANAMLHAGHKLIATGVDPGGLVRGMYEARDRVMEFIQNLATSITEQSDLERVAMLASNGDEEVARYLAEACMAVGKDGTVTIEDGVGMEVVLEFKEGMEIDQGPCSLSFLGGQPERVIESPLIAVIHGRLRSLADVQDLLEVASQWPQNELVVFCLTAETEALSVMVVNDTKGVMKSVAIGAPGVQFRKQEYLQDIAALAGAVYIDPLAGYDHKSWDPEWFGSLQKIIIQTKATILMPHGEADQSISDRIVTLRAEESRCTSDYDRDRLRERLAKLSGGMAILKIGGVTEIALKERRARVEDALGAVKAALRDGVVPGGGIAYLRAAANLVIPLQYDAVGSGWKVIKQALMKPLEVLADNAGEEGKVIIHTLLDKWLQNPSADIDWSGWDAITNQYRDLYADPMVMDPTAVALATIKAAVSVAATLLTVETAIVLKETA